MSANFEMQAIGRGDLGRISHVDPLTATDAQRHDHLGTLLDAGMSWGAFGDGRMIGFAIVTRHFYNFPFVDLLVVAGEARRHGAGSALMAHCAAAQWAMPHGADRMFTSTNESNAPMRALLAKSGWLPAGVVHYLDPGDPELIFVKPRG
ncbi:MAG TPA: GNAT family N-acetyltransferase [Caulobacteraceae bacterium]|jgi:GNAT superfamily N-acetyltransferase|nr:GNAT family N-acetyltransferase [Caulobacteraceae bacterium]